MGTRDYRKREPKKSKKGDKKTHITTLTPQTEVEVIKKSKRTASSSEE